MERFSLMRLKSRTGRGAHALAGDYRLLAQYFLALAKACTDPSNADRYRVIAADYFDRAGQVGGSPAQQQQQIQPPKMPGRSAD